MSIEFDLDSTYVICPDRACRLFWDATRPCPCDGACPQEDKQKLMVLCAECKEPVYVGAGSRRYCRVDHAHGDGSVASTFARLSGKYFLLYDRLK